MLEGKRTLRVPEVPVDVNDIIGQAEIAIELGVSKRRVQHWIERADEINSPKPVRYLSRGYLYLLSDWKGWFAVWRATRGPETWNGGRGRKPHPQLGQKRSRSGSAATSKPPTKSAGSPPRSTD